MVVVLEEAGRPPGETVLPAVPVAIEGSAPALALRQRAVPHRASERLKLSPRHFGGQ